MDFRLSINIPNLKGLGVVPQISKEIDAALLDLGHLGQRLVSERTPVGISGGGGGLRGSLFTELRGTSQAELARGAPSKREVIVASNLFYAPIVEAGRRPGRRPPIAPILLWVRRKLQISEPRATSVAVLISRKIGARGYPGYHMFERAWKQLEKLAQVRLDRLMTTIRDKMRG